MAESFGEFCFQRWIRQLLLYLECAVLENLKNMFKITLSNIAQESTRTSSKSKIGYIDSSNSNHYKTKYSTRLKA